MTIDSAIHYAHAFVDVALIIITVLGNTLPAGKIQRICVALGINIPRFFAELHGQADPTASTKTKAGVSSNDPASDALLASAAQMVASQKSLAEAVAKSSVVISDAAIAVVPSDAPSTNPSTPQSKVRASE